MRRVHLTMFLVLIALGGCQATRPEPEDRGAARIRELEARIAWLEAQVRLASVDEELLELQLQRAAMLVTYTADHPAVLDVECRIQALDRVRGLEGRARRDAMCRRLEAEREVLLGTYTPEHPSVRKIDAKIAYLKAGYFAGYTDPPG